MKPRDQVGSVRAAVVASNRASAIRRNLGRRYADCSLAAFEIYGEPGVANRQATVLASLQAFADGLKSRIADGSGLFLFGPSGTGKDHLLSALLIEADNRGHQVAWMNCQEICGKAREAFSGHAIESSIVEYLTSAAVLGISDLWLPKSSDDVGEVTTFQRALLFRVIDHRYRTCKPTWVTVNVSGREEAEDRLGVQLVDRLTDGALCLGCNWPSYRESRRWTTEDQ